MSVEVKIDVNDINRNMQIIYQAAADQIQIVAEQAYNNAKDPSVSPIKTGNNRRSITLDFRHGHNKMVHENEDGKPVPSGIDSLSVSLAQQKKNDIGFRVYTQSGYGGYLELGTSRMPARPYIKPGFERATNDMLKALNGVV